MKVAIGCDHGGINLKPVLIEYLDKQGIEYKDFGCFGKESVDYNDYALPVAKAVAEAGELSGLSAEQQAVVTGYLDAVVEIAGGEAVTIANYASPYTVTVEEGKLTVTGAVTAIKAVIVDGTVYTRGWSVEEDTLSATLPEAATQA